MRERSILKPQRMRLKLHSTILKVTYDTRPKDYLNLRFYWLHELRQLRAKRRIAGASVKKEIKAAQRALYKIREEFA